MTELEGKTLDHYELRRMIGKGGMANVYEAIDKQAGRIVAIKIFKREDVEMLRRFMREAQLMASWQDSQEHHLVPIYNYGTGELDHQTHYFIVMPYIEGGTLRARVRRGPLPLDEACHAIQNIATALDYIHRQGIIHRDIKASNVLINSAGDYFLTDFGIARITSDATQLTTTGNVLGTVDYVAPELFELDRKADVRSDLYSLGILLYEMVMGRLPFIAENQIALVSMHIQRRPPAPRSINPALPKAVEAVMLKALEKKPEQRYESAKGLADAFCRAVSSSTGVSIPDYATGAPPVAAPAPVSPVPRPGQLILRPPLQSLNPQGNVQEVSPSSWEKGTDGLRFPPQNQVPAPGYARVDAPLSPLPTPYQAQEPPKRPYYRRPWFSILVIVLALLIIAGSVAAITFPRGQANNAPGGSTQTTQAGQTAPVPGTNAPTHSTTPNLTATAQAAAIASATARAQATASAIAAVTATAQAQATATAGVILTATSGQPTYQDSLTNAASSQTVAAGWDRSDNCAFRTDGYHDTATSGLQGCKEANHNYTNAAITVVMRIVSGQSGGIFFRTTGPFTNFGGYAGYLFEVNSQGSYRILSSQNFNSGTPATLRKWTGSNALHMGGQSNTLQLIMNGNTFSFYANGAFLTQLSNSDFTGGGWVAFLAQSDSATAADVVYSDLNVYTMS